MLDSDGKAIQVGKTYRVSWQKFAGSCARYFFNCIARSVGGAMVLVEAKSRQVWTAAYLQAVGAKIHVQKKK